MNAPKHGGCADCKDRSERLLTSVVDPTTGGKTSRAVCSKCLPKYPESKR